MNTSFAFSRFASSRKHFGSYLAGLFEGDGHVTKTHFHITFHIKEITLVKKLIDKLGFGNIRYKLDNNACVLNIGGKSGLIAFINLINGELRTPKIRQLYTLIDYANSKFNTNIPKLALSKSHISENSWLAGFIEADGSFGIRNTKKTESIKKRNVSCRFRLEQRMLDPITNESYAYVLYLISDYLCVKLNTRLQKNTGRTYYIIESSSLESNTILRTYLEIHALFSSKYLDYTDWCKAHDLIVSKSQYTDSNQTFIEHLRNNMNNSRTSFNWDHLNYL